MRRFLEQINHNQNFYNCIDNNFKDKFYDWKITVLFYIAVHCLKSLSVKRNIKIGNTHFDIECNVNPDREGSKMKISRNAWREYKNLYQYSRTARYNGITDIETFEQLKQIDHKYCLEHLKRFKKYVKGQGVNISV